MSSSTPRPVGNAPMEEKVKWATVASYAAGLLLTGLANTVQDENHALLLGAMPEWLESLLLPLLIAAPTAYAGWRARHTPRVGGQ